MCAEETRPDMLKENPPANSYCRAFLEDGIRCNASIPVNEMYCKSCQQKLEERNQSTPQAISKQPMAPKQREEIKTRFALNRIPEKTGRTGDSKSPERSKRALRRSTT